MNQPPRLTFNYGRDTFGIPMNRYAPNMTGMRSQRVTEIKSESLATFIEISKLAVQKCCRGLERTWRLS